MKTQDDYPKPVSELIKEESGFNPDMQEAVEKSPEENEEFNLKFEPISLSELMKKDFPKTEWVVEQLIPAEGIVVISGLPSAYKTWLILELAVRVAKGNLLFDKFITSRTTSLIVDEETGERWIQQRLLKLLDDFDLPVYLLAKRGFKLTRESVKRLIALAKNKEVGLIIFDSFLRVHTARDENDAVQMAEVFNLLHKFTNEGIAVVLTHHHRKQGIIRSPNPSQDMRGSSDILAAVDCHLAIERKENFLIVRQTKLRQGEEAKSFRLSVVNEKNKFRFEYLGEVDESQTKKTDFKGAIKDILERENKPMYKKELYEILKSSKVEGGYSTFKSAIQEMIKAGELFENKGERNKVFCSLKPSVQEQALFKETDG